ncbi:serine/threonine-protein kinase [Myxococcus landrumensis]|uniref:non-specific serine/threonine protein kinase n=1 Tax=Myxococcus landrumensis TaxID=2813577 RepID=A0ABX7N0A1_9BACT|nr:serine/threonine-protein kinase [Myxococcus landrumus]QSQ12135.1 serine/threonine-protein kinase PknK [Myxococcus landrumus]
MKLLERGGMGEVFEAIHEPSGQRVAVKRLLPEASLEPHLVSRFLQERRLLVDLDIPDVVRAFHGDEQSDQLFLVMELLEGQSMRQWMAQYQGPVPREEALAFCSQVARVMSKVHERNIVHRDLKPENVFLCPDESAGSGRRTKVLDFGIAKLPPMVEDERAATQVHTHDSVLMGTHYYSAPEQIRSAAAVTGAADVYSLGVMLFELLVGKKPFDSQEMVEVIAAHLEQEAPHLGQCVPSIPGALSTFVASMLAKAPEGRPTMARCSDMLGRPWMWAQDTCPVPGLAAFSELQAELFFGRKKDTEALLDSLNEARLGSRRWVQLEGQSGVGKSSLLQAGVLPRLEGPGPSGAPRWCVAVARPSYEPLRSLAQALAKAFQTLDAEGVEQRLRGGPEALRTLVVEHVPKEALLLLVVDPLEELFTSGAAERLVLDGLLANALSGEDCRLRLLTSLRSDFVHRLELLPGVSQLLHRAARYPLLPMDEGTLVTVVRDMAKQAGLRLSDGLEMRMARDAKGEGGGLPLLGHALRSLWATSGGAQLTHQHYDRMGGVGGALSQQAEELLASLGEKGLERAKWLLLGLVQVGRGAPDTRRPRARRELLREAGGDELAEAILLRLSGHSAAKAGESGPRLVVLSGEPEPEAQRVDLVHETLLQRVGSLVRWLDEERRRLELRANLEDTARHWEEAGRPSDGLPQGTLLAQYKEGGAGGRGISARAESFLLASTQMERRAGTMRRARVVAASLAMCAMLFVTVRAESERQRADKNLIHVLDTANEIVSDADWELSWIPHTLEVRRSLLRELASTVQGLQEEDPQRHEVLGVRVDTAHRQADVEFLNGSLRAAERHLETARELLRQASQRGFVEEDHRMQWALNHSKQGKVDMAAGRLKEARFHFVQSDRFFDEQRANSPPSLEGNRGAAVSIGEKAELEFKEGRPREAIRLFGQALSLFSKVDPKYGASLHAESLGHQAEVLRREGRVEESRRQLDEAVGLLRPEVEAHPWDQHRRLMLARVLVWNARLAADEARWSDADASYREAVRMGVELRAGEKDSKRFALVLAEALLGLEQLEARRGKLTPEPWRADRCALVQEFIKQDAEDVRFKALACEEGATR